MIIISVIDCADAVPPGSANLGGPGERAAPTDRSNRLAVVAVRPSETDQQSSVVRTRDCSANWKRGICRHQFLYRKRSHGVMANVASQFVGKSCVRPSGVDLERVATSR